MTVKKAVVLAAGFGTRLRPFTSLMPKPLLPVWGASMLTRVVQQLRDWGVEEITVNCHYLHEQIEAWCAANNCRVSYEPEILGTGGALNPLKDWIGQDDFYLVNGDIVFEGFEGFKETREFAREDVLGLAVVTTEGPRTIEVEPTRNIVTCWKSPDPGYDGTYTYCGIALLKPAIFDFLAPEGASSIVEAYEKATMSGHFILGVEPKGLLWTDAGTIPKYIEVNQQGDANDFGALPQIAEAQKQLSLPEAVEFLGARGSNRCFFKVGNAIIILYDDEARKENARYATLAQWLAAKGIAVPKVLLNKPEMKMLVLENAGSTDLATEARRKGTLLTYRPVVEALAAFGKLADESDLPELEAEFNAALWAEEQALFKEYALGRRYARACSEEVEKDFAKLTEVLEKEPRALVHRDFQSSNVLWKNGKLSIIDFQGMRKGPAVYDLASLVYDPYMKLTMAERAALVTLYGKVTGRDDIAKVLPFAAAERLIQALGAYGRLASVGQTGFSQYILPALENLLAVADEAGLDALGALAEELIAMEMHFEHERHHHHHAAESEAKD